MVVAKSYEQNRPKKDHHSLITHHHGKYRRTDEQGGQPTNNIEKIHTNQRKLKGAMMSSFLVQALVAIARQ